MSKVWIGTFSELTVDPRPNRTMTLLQDRGFNCSPLQETKKIVSRRRRTQAKLKYLWFATRFHLGIKKSESCEKFLKVRYHDYSVNSESLKEHDSLVMFDLDFLGFLINQPKRCKYVMDLREIYPEQYGKSISFRYGLRPIRKYLLKRHFTLIDAATTVSFGLQDYYSDRFQINTSLIRSTPHYSRSKSLAKVEEPFRIVYFGVAHPLRKLEDCIHACSATKNNIELHFYLVGDPEYIEELKKECSENLKIWIHDPVPFEEIHSTLIQYDLGWCYFSPTTENISRALPNKYFDYIQAGLGVICGPNPDMIRESMPWGFGIFTQEFSRVELVQLLDSLSATKIEEAKKAARDASEALHFGIEGKKLFEVLEMVWKKN
jgi:glycosyltransferase involved in cell wall biosynthesis